MRHHTRRRLTATFAATAAASVVLAGCGGGLGGDGDSSGSGGNNAAGDDPCAALEGETVTVVVPYNPGGGFDTQVRLLQPYLEKQLDGTTINVVNKPGGGGLIGANEVYNSQPSDLTIGLINYAGATYAELTGQEGATFDNTKWTFLGRLAALPPVLYTGPNSKYDDFQAVLDATTPVKFGIGGVGSDAYYVAVGLSQIFDFPNEIIAGYPGSGEADAALLVGEVDASINSAGAALEVIQGSGARPLVVISSEKVAELPDTPVIGDFGEGDQTELLSAMASVADLERVVVGPPGMDEGISTCLADAVFAAASDSGYAKEAKDAGYPVNPLSQGDTKALVQQVTDAAGALRGVLKQG